VEIYGDHNFADADIVIALGDGVDAANAASAIAKTLVVCSVNSDDQSR
jgi:hypothetical protein